MSHVGAGVTEYSMNIIINSGEGIVVGFQKAGYDRPVLLGYLLDFFIVIQMLSNDYIY